MTKLTKVQRELLARAADHEGVGIDSDPKLQTTSTSLIKQALMISLPQEKGASRLLITSKGLAAIERPASAPEGFMPRDQRSNSEVAPPTGKLDKLVSLLSRPGGATIADLMAETGWQAHSLRGAISGSLKKTRKLAVTSEVVEGARTYRIVPAA